MIYMFFNLPKIHNIYEKMKFIKIGILMNFWENGKLLELLGL